MNHTFIMSSVNTKMVVYKSQKYKFTMEKHFDKNVIC